MINLVVFYAFTVLLVLQEANKRFAWTTDGCTCKASKRTMNSLVKGALLKIKDAYFFILIAFCAKQIMDFLCSFGMITSSTFHLCIYDAKKKQQRSYFATPLDVPKSRIEGFLKTNNGFYCTICACCYLWIAGVTAYTNEKISAQRRLCSLCFFEFTILTVSLHWRSQWLTLKFGCFFKLC